MQQIIAFSGGPEEYVRDGAHRKMARPDECPICGKSGGMRPHGFYPRSVTIPGPIMRLLIQIRRFLCFFCRRTTSMLPDFAQPYRLVATDTVNEYLAGSRDGAEVTRWSEHLGRYQQRFEDRIPETREALATAYNIGKLSLVATDLWGEVCRDFGGARRFTARFAGEVGMTVFGIYRCHRPTENSSKHIDNNLARGRDPPISALGHDNGPNNRSRFSGAATSVPVVSR